MDRFITKLSNFFTKPNKNSNPKKPLETLLVDSEKTDQESDDHFGGFYSSRLARGKP